MELGTTSQFPYFLRGFESFESALRYSYSILLAKRLFDWESLNIGLNFAGLEELNCCCHKCFEIAIFAFPFVIQSKF